MSDEFDDAVVDEDAEEDTEGHAGVQFNVNETVEEDDAAEDADAAEDTEGHGIGLNVNETVVEGDDEDDSREG